MITLYKILLYPAAFAGVIGLFQIFSEKGSFALGVFLVAIFVATIILLFAQIKADKNDFFKKVEKFGSAKYKEHLNSTGIAITTTNKLVLSIGLKVKAYDFSDVRQWRTSIQNAGMVLGGGLNGAVLNGIEGKRAADNTGLFISVRDIDSPEWHIKFKNKDVLNKWYEILQQEINER